MVSCCCFGAFFKLLQIIIALSNLIALTARGKLCKFDDMSVCLEYYNVRNFLCLKHWVSWHCYEALGLLLPVISTIFSLISIAMNCATAKKRAKRLDAGLSLINAVLWIGVGFVFYYFSKIWWSAQMLLKKYDFPFNWYFAGVTSVILAVLYSIETIVIISPSTLYYEQCCPKTSSFLDTSDDGSVMEKDEETNLMQVTLAVPKMTSPKRSNSCNT